jgi:hypothetical protein
MATRKNTKIVQYHLPQLEALAGTAQKTDYLADLIAGEGLGPAAEVLASYCGEGHRDGLLVYTLLLKREQEFEGDIGDLLASLVKVLPR